jgi:amino acid adenylation domain-containing protein
LKPPTIFSSNRFSNDDSRPIKAAEGVGLNTSAGSRERIVSPSPQQVRFWFLDRLHQENSSAQLIFMGVRVVQSVSRACLESSLNQVVSRHDALRSRFIYDFDGLKVIVDPPREFAVEWHDVASVAPSFWTPSSLPPETCERLDLCSSWPFHAIGVSGPDGHIIFLALHHIAADARSIEVLETELIAAVEAAIKQERAFADAAPSYHSVTGQIGAALVPASRSKQLRYWRRTLKGVPVLDFPTDRIAALPRSMQSNRERLHLSGEVAKWVDFIARDAGISHAALFTAAFSFVLLSHTQQLEIAVGIPVSQRHKLEFANCVGPLLNVVALRCRPKAHQTFRGYARTIRRRLASAIIHSDVPFEEVVAEVSSIRDGLPNPLYQVMLSYHHVAPAATRNGSFAGSVDVFGGTVSSDLCLTVTFDGQSFLLDLDGDSNRISKDVIKRLSRQLATFLEDVIRRPDDLLANIAVIPPEERNDLLVKLNRNAKMKAGHQSILGGFRRSVSEAPQQVAIQHGGDSLTFKELDGISDSLALQLRHTGIQPGAFVPVWAQRGCDFAISCLAVLKTGAAFVPLDPSLPASLIGEMGKQLQCSLIVNAPAKIAASGLSHVPVTRSFMAEFPFEFSSENPEAAMYAIFTSGSTGRPKAAVIPHRGILNRINWMIDFSGARPPVVLATTAPVYDSAVWQLFWPLMTGGLSVIAEDHSVLEAGALLELIAQHKVTVTDFVPSLLVALLPALEASPEARLRMKSLNWVIIGGETLLSSLTNRLLELLPQARITNLYGPTEASIGCIYHEVLGPAAGRIPIGRPIPNVSALVIGRDGRLVPRGAIGELCLVGACVGLGYLGGVTGGYACLHFIPELAGLHCYRTGDLCRWNETNELEFIGRQDLQVKIRGVRIEAGAVQAAIEADPAVANALVDSAGEPSSEQRSLVAYVQLREGSSLDHSTLTGRLRRVLPPSHLPDQIFFVENLPVAKSGKMDFKTLRQSCSLVDSPNLAPKDRMESEISDIWRQIIGTPKQIMGQTNFFEAGGNSLLLVRLQMTLRERYKKPVSILDLFRHPTVNSQTELLRHYGTLANAVS